MPRRLVVTAEGAAVIRQMGFRRLYELRDTFRRRDPALDERRATTIAAHVLAVQEPTLWQAFRDANDVWRACPAAPVPVRPAIPLPDGRLDPLCDKPA